MTVSKLFAYLLGNWKLLFSTALLIIAVIVAITRIAYFFDVETYWTSTVSDDAYYYAIGKSLAETGEIRNIALEPKQGPLNAHIGIAFAYAFFYSIHDTAENVIKYSGVYTMLLYFFSLFVVYKIFELLGLSKYANVISISFLMLHPLYFNLALTGRTEGFFYPLVILWFYVVLKWWKSDFELDWKLLSALFLCSFFAYSFRLQALILFLALLLAVLAQRKYTASAVVLCIASLSVLSVLRINKWLGGIGMGRGETGHFSQITDFNIERFFDFLPVIGTIFYNYDRVPLLSYLFFGLLIFLIATVLYHAYKTNNFLLWLAFFVIGGSILSIILFRQRIQPSHLRYILYILPFLLVGVSWIIHSMEPKRLKVYSQWLSCLLIAGFAILALRHTSQDWQVREQGVKDWYQRSADRYYTVKQIHETYPEAKRFTSNSLTSPETIRLLFAATDEPSFTNFNFDSLEPNSLTVLRDDNEILDRFYSSNNDYELLYEFQINNSYKVFYIP